MNYSNYSDDDLIEAYSSMMNYSGKITDELSIEIEKRGGIENFLFHIEAQNLDKIEAARILKEIIGHMKNGLDYESIRTNVQSKIWNKEKLDYFVATRFDREWSKVVDQTIYSSTISGCIHAFIIGSVLSSLIYACSIWVDFKIISPVLVVNFYVTYLFAKLFTGQSRNNFLIFITCLLATIASFFGGLYILELLEV
jgi:hypothetical protein